MSNSSWIFPLVAPINNYRWFLSQALVVNTLNNDFYNIFEIKFFNVLS